MSLLIGITTIVATFSTILAINATDKQPQIVPLKTIFARPASTTAVKGFVGLESLLGVMGPLALAAMVSLPFVAPAAAALIPLASLSSVFGRRRRHLDNPRDSHFLQDTDALMRRIHAAAIRRNIY